VLLLCGGLTYGAWSLHRAVSRKVATGGLLLFFALDPCVALIPLLFAAAPLGAGAAVAVGLTYGAATLSTMLLMVLPIRHGLTRWSTPFVERWGHALAGASVAAVGVAVMVLGV
jgi:Na+/citrate or Na+/malate symporter